MPPAQQSPHANPVVEWIAQAIWEASDDFQDDPSVKWEHNFARDEWYRMALAIVGSGRVYEVSAEAETPGNVVSWVGDEDHPTEDYPEWLDEIQSGLVNAVIGWGRNEDEGDIPNKLTAIVFEEPEW